MTILLSIIVDRYYSLFHYSVDDIDIVKIQYLNIRSRERKIFYSKKNYCIQYSMMTIEEYWKIVVVLLLFIIIQPIQILLIFETLMISWLFCWFDIVLRYIEVIFYYYSMMMIWLRNYSKYWLFVLFILLTDDYWREMLFSIILMLASILIFNWYYSFWCYYDIIIIIQWRKWPGRYCWLFWLLFSSIDIVNVVYLLKRGSHYLFNVSSILLFIDFLNAVLSSQYQ